MWDPDGPGPRAPKLVIGGTFTRAGATPANNIVAYDLATGEWSALGTGFSDPSYVNVLALATLSDGQLVAAGHFAAAGGVSVNNIARWDGTAWQAMGLGLGGSSNEGGIYALILLANGDLVAGGDFTTAGGVPARGVARWSGGTWSAMDAGLGPCSICIRPSVSAFAVSPSGTLYACGGLTGTGSTNSRIARWSGTSWVALASTTTNGGVTAICFLSNGDLIVGGSFTMAGTVAVNKIARWNGTSWFALGSGLVGASSGLVVQSLQRLPDGSVIAIGGFQTAGGTTVNGVARWSNNTWTGFGTGLMTNLTGRLGSTIAQLPGGEFFVGGDFLLAGGVAAYRTAIWSGTAWRGLGSGFHGPTSLPGIFAFTKTSDDRLIAGGSFTFTNGIQANRIAQWDGTRWSAMGTGMNNPVWTLDTAPNGDLIAGGVFTTADGQPCAGVARWNGTVWSSLGSGVGGQYPWVNVLLALPNGDVIAAGSFTSAGGNSANCIARWNGTTWTPLGLGMSGVPFFGPPTIFALKRHPNGDIIAAGNFTMAGGVPARCVARWDGATWSPLGEGIGERAHALTILPNGHVVVAGWFTSAGGQPANRIAQWDGVAWSSMGAGMAGAPGSGGDVDVDALMVRPNGDLIAGGYFTTAGSATVYSIARWNGSDWSPFGQGVRGRGTSCIFAMLPLTDDEFAVGGTFDTTTGVTSSYFSRWTESNIPWVALQPQAAQVAEGASIILTASPANGYSNIRVRWQRHGVDVADGPGGASPTGGVVSGASVVLASPTRSSVATLRIANARPSDSGEYTAIIGNDCGSVTSRVAVVTIRPNCVADTDDGSGSGTPDGGVTIDDLLYYLDQFTQGAARADLDNGSGTGTPDGGVTIDDLLYFIARYAEGC